MQLDRSAIHLAREDSQDLWSFADSVLYNLCRECPDHSDPLKVVAKVFLIGRAYAASAERRRNASQSLAPFYRDHVAKAIVNSDLDSMLSPLRGLPRLTDSELPSILAVHYSFISTLKSATGHTNTSLASKYLHFHVPNLFPLYDSYASKALAQWRRRKRPSRSLRGNFDPTYRSFVLKWLDLRDSIEREHGILLSPRQLDRILLGNAGSARSEYAA